VSTLPFGRTLIAAVVFAVSAVAADPPPSIDKLVEQLGSPSFPTRERATKALKERGPDALPALRKAMESKDEEVRKRAESLIPGLEIEEALLPKRVTLKAADTPLGDVLRDIEKQTGLKVTPDGGAGEKISVQATDVPFWETIEQLGKASGWAAISVVHNRFDGSPPTLHLAKAATRSPFVDVRGPWRLEATWFHEDRDVDLTETKPGADGWRNKRLTLAVSVLAEPRLTLLQVHPAKVDEAIDSDGKSLIAPVEPGLGGKLQKPMRGTFQGEHLHSSDVRLRRASETAKTAKLIRGTIPVKAILIRKPTVISAKVTEAGGTTFKAGNETLTVTHVNNQGGNNIEVSIRTPYHRDGHQPDWHERFRVEDEAGNAYQMNGRGTSSNGVEYTIQMYFAPPFNKKGFGPPTKLIFEDWIVHDHAIPFEFRDVPLP
jgi:hypothetical protein